MWLTRIGNMLKSAGKVVLVEGNSLGVSELADTLLTPNGTCLWVDFDSTDTEELRQVAWGLPVKRYVHSLQEALRLHAELLHVSVEPILIVTHAENGESCVAELLADMPATRHKLLISGRSDVIHRLALKLPDANMFSAAELSVTLDEIVDYLGDAFSHGKWPSDTVIEPPISYDELKSSNFVRLGLDAPDRPTPRRYSAAPACLTRDSACLLTLLQRNRQWQRALDAAISLESGDLERIIDAVGEDALQSGRINQFYRKLSSLTPEQQASEHVIYWLLIAEQTLGIDSTQYRDINRLKNTVTYPRLKLLLTTLGLDSHRAFDSDLLGPQVLRNSTQEERVHALHLKAFVSPDEETVDQLHRVIGEYARAGRHARQVRTISILANALLLHGKYNQAKYWSTEAHRLAHAYGLDELERAVTTAGAAYSRILTGDFETASELMSSVKDPEALIGLPSAEGVLSTVADLFVVAGHYGTALRWFELAATSCEGPAADIQLPDIALMLVRTGEPERAVHLVRARYAEIDVSALGYQWVQLASAISLLEIDREEAIRQLNVLIDSSRVQATALVRARASILLALLYFETEEARGLAVLDAAEPDLLDLGESGWRLLAGNLEGVTVMREQWIEHANPITVRFLGDDYWSYLGSTSSEAPGLRLKELLLVLSLHPGGLSGNQLADIMEWGYDGNRTVRSNIRRLRRFLPVGARPYRLTNRLDADYLHLSAAITDGDAVRALKIYQGSLLRESELNFVMEYRQELETRLKVLLLNRGTPEQLANFALQKGDDIDLLEEALRRQPPNSDIGSSLQARIQILLAELKSV